MSSKSPEKPKNFESIEVPIPSVFRDAVRRIINDGSHVSLQINGKNPPESQKSEFLNSENHAIYIGKFLDIGFLAKLKKFAGLGGYESIYSPEVMAVMMRYIQEHSASDGPINIRIGRSLSELFNGPDDVAKALTFEEQRARIEKTAKKRCGIPAERLNITKMEDPEIHQALFAALRASIDKETHCADPDKAFGNTAESGEDPVPFPENPNSLDIARLLYRAAQGSEDFCRALDSTVPDHFKKEADESDLERMRYYGMTEIAMRLADFLSGVTVHAGVSRQAKYDDIIIQIIKGEGDDKTKGKGRFKSLSVLKPLFALLKNKSFATLHFNSADNPEIQRSRKITAWARMAVASVLIGSGALGFYTAGQQSEKRKKANIEVSIRGQLADRLKDARFHMYGPLIELNKSDNPERAKRCAELMLDEFKARYQINDIKLIDDIRPLLLQSLTSPGNLSLLSTAHDNYSYGNHRDGFYALLEYFIHEHKLYFIHKKIDTSHPYPAIHKYLPQIKTLLASTGNEVFSNCDPANLPYLVGTCRDPAVSLIGEFNTIFGWSEPDKYSFYHLTQGNRRLIVGEKGNEKGVYSTKVAREAARAYLEILQNREMSHFLRYQNLFLALSSEHGSYYYPAKLPADKKAEELQVTKIGIYHESASGIRYEMGIYYLWDEKLIRSLKILVARPAGSREPFSLKTARKVARRFCIARYPWSKDREQNCKE